MLAGVYLMALRRVNPDPAVHAPWTKLLIKLGSARLEKLFGPLDLDKLPPTPAYYISSESYAGAVPLWAH